jgi:DNA-binding response OmpR family regulator
LFIRSGSPTGCVHRQELPSHEADLEQALTDAGFAIDAVSSGEEALTLFVGGTTNYRALVSDVRLRGSMSGWDVARRIREKEPAFPVVTLSRSPLLEHDWLLRLQIFSTSDIPPNA